MVTEPEHLYMIMSGIACIQDHRVVHVFGAPLYVLVKKTFNRGGSVPAQSSDLIESRFDNQAQ